MRTMPLLVNGRLEIGPGSVGHGRRSRESHVPVGRSRASLRRNEEKLSLLDVTPAHPRLLTCPVGGSEAAG